MIKKNKEKYELFQVTVTSMKKKDKNKEQQRGAFFR